MRAPSAFGGERLIALALSLRPLLVVGALAALVGTGIARAQAADSEAALRETIAQYQQAWNRHDVKAWAAFLTPDVDYRHYAHGDTGRDAAIATQGYNVVNQDLKWEVVRVRVLPGGSATVVMRTELGVLPIKDGKYQGVFTDYPAISRWRVEDGQWRMYFFTSFKARGAEIVKNEALE